MKLPVLAVLCLFALACDVAQSAVANTETAPTNPDLVENQDGAVSSESIRRELSGLAKTFPADYELDTALSRVWRSKNSQNAELSLPPFSVTELFRLVSGQNGPPEFEKQIETMLKCGKSLVNSFGSEFDGYAGLIEKTGLPAELARALEDIVLFFRFASVRDNWHVFSDVRKRHREIVAKAGDGEAVALQLRMIRLLVELNPDRGDLVGNRIMAHEQVSFIMDCLQDSRLRPVASVWFRTARFADCCNRTANRIRNVPEEEFPRFSVKKVNAAGVLEDVSFESSRETMASFYSGEALVSYIRSEAWHATVSFPFSVVESFSRDIAHALGIEDETEIAKDVQRADALSLAEIGDLTGFWERKAKYEGWNYPEFIGTPQPPDPGHLEPYVATDALKAEMARYGLEAGWFVQEDSSAPSATNRLAWLLHAPKRGGKLPLVLFVPGAGEMGPDLSRQFHQRTIFEKVTSAEFQKKHPCYLLVISPPEDCPDLCGYGPDMKPGKYQRPFLDALSAIIRTQKSPVVDTDRIYVTGLSMGGRSIYGLSFVAPHLFAACVPVSSGVFSPEDVREERPGNWWHLYNEGDYARHPDSIPRLEAFAARVRELGGDFRIGTYPVEGHNAWDAAWREDALWDWMFSKSLANERPASIGGARLTKTAKADRSLSGKVVCTASKAGFDAKRGPERAADGLDATAYVSAVPMGPGDWWLCEFKEPVTGRIRVQTGWLDGTKRLSRGHVEVSKDGKLWSRAAAVSGKSGEASFQQRDPIRFVKLLTEPRTPEVLTLRELRLE